MSLSNKTFLMYIEVKLYYGQNRLIKRVIMPNEIEEVVAYNSEIGEVGCIDINNAALMEKILQRLDNPINEQSKVKLVRDTRTPQEILSAMSETMRINEESGFIVKVPGGYKMNWADGK